MRNLLHSLVFIASLFPTVGTAEQWLEPGEMLTEQQVAVMIEPWLPPARSEAQRALTISSPMLPLPSSSKQRTVLKVVAFDFDSSTGRFEGRLHAKLESGSSALLSLAGQLNELVEVPVLARSVRRGEAALAGLLDYTRVERHDLPTDVVLSADELQGLETARHVQAGKPLRYKDLRPETLVRRGQSLSLTYHRHGLELRVPASALDNGILGQTVKVIADGGERAVRAVVTGHKRATVGNTLQQGATQ